MAERCLKRAKDLSGLLLLHTARGSQEGVETLVSDAQGLGRHNVAFLGLFLLGKLDACIDLLAASGRVPEAALFARTYKPSRMSEVSHHQSLSLAPSFLPRALPAGCGPHIIT